jgi:hypothetical protein
MQAQPFATGLRCISAAILLSIFAPIAEAQTFNCQIPVPTLKDRLIQESISRYPGNCPCPFNRDARGHRCGKRSAWNRAGGYSPLCFAEDVTPDMVREYCEVLKLRGEAVSGG